jgi:hypothetical protein
MVCILCIPSVPLVVSILEVICQLFRLPRSMDLALLTNDPTADGRMGSVVSPHKPKVPIGDAGDRYPALLRWGWGWR